jgi:DMSO reductase family type II enzyme heme b subunit
MEAQLASGTGVEQLLDPDNPVWARAGEDPLQMIGTPAGLQPTAAIRNTWLSKKIGAVEHVQVRAVHNGELLAFRLAWDDPTLNDSLTDTTSFQDAAAIAFPASPDAAAATMGAPGAAVNAWHWRADEKDGGRQVVAEGLGTTRSVDPSKVHTSGAWKGGRWRVVIARGLQMETSEPVIQLEPGQITRYAVAVWNGAQQERAGIKGFSGDWRELRLAPAPMARR